MSQPGVIPTPPVIPEQVLFTIVPYKFGITITSNYYGVFTNYIVQLSIIISSYFKVG
jgi:hypothetical protein